ncbi:MAG: hypothetical protein IPM17_08025 [Verrucomicrobia bacterium]|nr:hypothetical protein [Verrucomicrobiota bacterium]
MGAAGSDGAPGANEARFYLPENPNYTIVASTLDSLRFTVDKTLKLDRCGHLVSISSFVNPDGEIMGWHDFGNLEGPGWAANAVGGAWEIWSWGRFTGDPSRERQALRILDHVLDCGFLNERTGFIRGYRETATGRFVLNYKHNSEWFCPGSMAKVAFQLLRFADDLPATDARRDRMRRMAVRTAEWIAANVEPVPNGWFPRRTTVDGKIVRRSPDGGDDPFWQTSADGLFILQLQAALTQRRLADYRRPLREKVAVFMEAGGIFGSINHDTYDPHENVAYSVAFRTLLLASRVLNDRAIRQFAYDRCLAGLDQFKMTEDRNNVATKGLLYMEKSWDTAYLWENAEAALAYFEAAQDSRRERTRARSYELDGLTILRAAAKHHYGPHGFLTEGVDWNDHVGQQHHIGHAKYGAIQYTEPFLNNQHIAEPTLFYLEHLATQRRRGNVTEWLDLEGNVLWCRERREPIRP